VFVSDGIVAYCTFQRRIDYVDIARLSSSRHFKQVWGGEKQAFLLRLWLKQKLVVCVAEASGVRRENERHLWRLNGGGRTCSRRMRCLIRRQRFFTHQRGESRRQVFRL